MMRDDASRDPLRELRPADDDLAFRDELTGAYNRRLLSKLLDEEWSRITERVDRVAIVMIDMDLFKLVNDRYGHLSGDEVLRATARLLKSHFRRSDFVFRYGGDEFVALLPGAGTTEASDLARRARIAILEHEFFTPSERRRIEVPVSFSIGTASWPEDGPDGQALLGLADGFLYSEKSARRRRARGRSRRIAALAMMLVVAIGAGLVSFVLRKEAGMPGPPPPSPAAIQERRELLQQITQLRARIDALSQAPPSQSESAGQDQRDVEIATLEAQVRSLSSQLAATKQESATRGDAERSQGAAAPAAEIDTSTSVSPDIPPSVPVTALREPAPPTVSGDTDLTTTAPRLVREIRPDYPAIAREFGREATVELVVIVDSTGKVVHARTVGKRLGLGFEEAAVQAARKSLWIPATRGGTPISAEASLKITFRMDKR